MDIMTELRKLINEEIDKRLPIQTWEKPSNPGKAWKEAANGALKEIISNLPRTKEQEALLANSPPRKEYSFHGGEGVDLDG